MASDTTTTASGATETANNPGDWKAGVVSGLAGGVVFGIMLSVMMTPVIQRAIPALFGLSGGVAGWIIHMSFSAVWGVGFAAVAGALGYGDDLGPSIGLGVGYGAALWLVNIVFIWPVWLQAVGFPAAPTVPNLAVMPLIGHLVYGLVLGAVYPYSN